MEILSWSLLAGCAVLLAAMLALLLGLRRRLQALRARLSLAPVLPPEGAGRPLITVEILNPFELAASRTAIAGPASRLAPLVIERIVYQTAVGILRKEIEKHGVIARVRAHYVE